MDPFPIDSWDHELAYKTQLHEIRQSTNNDAQLYVPPCRKGPASDTRSLPGDLEELHDPRHSCTAVIKYICNIIQQLKSISRDDQKIHAPDFNGDNSGGAFIDCLLQVEAIFEYKKYGDNKCALLAQTKLKKRGYALVVKLLTSVPASGMGGLVVKQMLYEARTNDFTTFLNNTVGIVFYSCPHFGSKLADMPWQMGFVLRPAPSIGELRSGSPRLVELNDFIRQLHKKGSLDVLSFSETKVTPIVEGYGGWAFRMEIVPIESAYPGFGELVVLDSTDHINSCKPVSRADPSYKETLDFLQKLKTHYTHLKVNEY